MYVRFVVADIDDDSGRETGVFQAIYDLRDRGELYPYEEAEVERVRQWFNRNLDEPGRFTSAKRPYYRKKNRAISWFKDSALEHIAHMREFVSILENHGIIVEMLKSDRVGYVVYEDEHQIVAEPFSEAIR